MNEHGVFDAQAAICTTRRSWEAGAQRLLASSQLGGVVTWREALRALLEWKEALIGRTALAPMERPAAWGHARAICNRHRRDPNHILRA